MRKCIAILMVMCMVLTTLAVPSVAFGDVGTTHTVKLYMVDDNGVPDERPYFEIEVKDGQSLDAAKEEQDKYFNYPERLGYDAAWRTGTIGSDGKVQYGDTYMDSSTVESVKQDYTFYLEWMKIEPGNLGYKLTINAPDSNSVSVTEDGRSILNNMLNTAIRGIANYNIESGDNYEVYEKLPKEFIIAAGKSKENAGTVEMVFDIKETRDDQGNLTDISFDCKLKLLDADGTAVNDDNGMPIEGNIDNFDSGVGIQVALDYAAEGDCYCLLEMDDQGAVVDREESWVENGLLNYYWLVRSMSDYRLLYDEEMSGGGNGDYGGGDGSDYIVPSDMIQVEYTYYDAAGRQQYIAVAIAADSKSTYKQLLEKEEARLDHYEALGDVTYLYEGGSFSDGRNWDQDMLNDKAEGGLILYANVVYEKILASTEVRYYDVNGEYVSNKKLIAMPQGSTYEDLLNEITLPSDDKHYSSYGFQGWAYGRQPDEFDRDSLAKEELRMYDSYDSPFVVAARYAKYPITINYTYPVADSKGYAAKTKTAKRIVSVVAGDGTSFIDTCKALPCDGGTRSTYNTWHVSGFTEIDSNGNPTPFLHEIHVAAQDGDYIPVFVDYYSIEKIDGFYEGQNEIKVYYINKDTEPENIEDAVCEEVTKRHVSKVAGLDFDRYVARGTGVHRPIEAADSFIPGTTCMIEASYDKMLIDLKWGEGSGNPQREQTLVKFGSYYTLPQKNNHIQIWDIGGHSIGGRYEMSGSKILADKDEFGHYITLTSRYALSIGELEKAQSQTEEQFVEIKLMLKEKALKDKNFVEAKTQMKYLDVELSKVNHNGEWEQIHDGQFPAGGLDIYLPYPEGTSAKTHNFSVTHLISSDNHPGKKKGDIEVLDVEETEQGLKVTVRSLSPIAIAYEDTKAAGKDKATKTGDNYKIIPLVVIMTIAAVGAVAILFRRRTVK